MLGMGRVTSSSSEHTVECESGVPFNRRVPYVTGQGVLC